MCATMNVLARHEPAPTEENPLTYISDLSEQLEDANRRAATHQEQYEAHEAEAANIHLLIMEHLDLGHTDPYAMTVVEQLLTELRQEAYAAGYNRCLHADAAHEAHVAGVLSR